MAVTIAPGVAALYGQLNLKDSETKPRVDIGGSLIFFPSSLLLSFDLVVKSVDEEVEVKVICES